jgi:hypothetical protein
LDSPRVYHRRFKVKLVYMLSAAVVWPAFAQTPDLAKPPANAQHFTIESTGGKHGDSWMWTDGNGNRRGRESMNLRGQVFDLESEGNASVPF